MSEKVREWHKRKLEEFAKEHGFEEATEEEPSPSEPTEEELAQLEKEVEEDEVPVYGTELSSEQIKGIVIEKIGQMSEQEQILRQESEKDIQAFRQNMTSFAEFLSQFREKVETALEEGKIESKDQFEKLLSYFEGQKALIAEQSKIYNEILATIKETEVKRRKAIDQFDKALKQVEKENQQILETNKMIRARLEKAEEQDRIVQIENDLILAENKKIVEKNKKLYEHLKKVQAYNEKVMRGTN